MLKFGTGGYPPAFYESPYRKNRLAVFQWLNEIGLDAFEAQMTYGPRTKPEVCKEINKLSKDFNIKVSVHAAYYIVLTSDDPAKIKSSVETLKKTYELADIMGADVIVLHPGPLYSKPSAEIYKILEENLHNFFNNFGDSHIGLFLETAGKKGQLGSVDEVISLSKSIKGCFPCFDFGHIHARADGCLSSEKQINDLIDKLKKEKVFENRHHFHYTPIDFGPKGEITHKALEDCYPKMLQTSMFDDSKSGLYHPRPEPIIKKLTKAGANCTIISETHNSQDKGALRMKEIYNSTL